LSRFMSQCIIFLCEYSKEISVERIHFELWHHTFVALFSPESGGGGHQPYGFDQLALLYGEYRVFKTSWIIQINNEAIPMRFGTYIFQGTPPTLASWQQVAERPGFFGRELGGNVGQNRSNIRGHAYIPRVLGMTSIAFRGDDDTQAPVTSNPSHQAQMAICTDSALAHSVVFDITLTYYVEFTNPITFANS